jgi:hypothetical protein
VDGTPDGIVIGIVKRADVATKYLRHVHGNAAPTEEGEDMVS